MIPFFVYIHRHQNVHRKYLSLVIQFDVTSLAVSSCLVWCFRLENGNPYFLWLYCTTRHHFTMFSCSAHMFFIYERKSHYPSRYKVCMQKVTWNGAIKSSWDESMEEIKGRVWTFNELVHEYDTMGKGAFTLRWLLYLNGMWDNLVIIWNEDGIREENEGIILTWLWEVFFRFYSDKVSFLVID